MVQSITSESDDAALSIDSPLTSDGDNVGGSSSGGVVLKKGPWTSAEDATLVNYVKKHGEGNWNAVQKHSGLLRCGKSCRLRWANHLRPNLKKGAFTSEEERLIIELHARMGNKWARMAAHLPGRTDNEIKNYWNTRIKRRHRAGLPLYPPELCIQTEPENQLSSPEIYGGDQRCHNILQNCGYKTPDAMFESLNSLTFSPGFSDYCSSGSLVNGFSSPQFCNFIPQTTGLQRRAQEQDEPMADYGADAANKAPPFDRAHNYSCQNKMPQPFGLSFTNDRDHTEKLLLSGVNQESHFMLNDIFSASKPFTGAEKLELPSLQYEDTFLGVWDPPPESIDSLVQSPRSRPLPSQCSSPRSSGLLEALLYEAKSKSDNQDSDKSTSFTISPGDSALKTCSMELKGYLDPASPSDNSMESIFHGCPSTDTIGNSLEEKIPVWNANSEVDQSWIRHGQRKLDFSRPDVILGSCWLQERASCSEQRGFVNDTTSSFLGDDLGSELKSVSYGTSASASNWGLTSCNWNNMPAAYQMSDFP